MYLIYLHLIRWFSFQIPTINQENGVVGGEPTESLVKFRSGKVLCPDRKGQGKVTFVIKYFLLNFIFM